jgi:hypothetical protein
MRRMQREQVHYERLKAEIEKLRKWHYEDRDWEDDPLYASYVDIGWNPFEFITFDEAGSDMWIFLNGRGGGYTIRDQYETPFNGLSATFARAYEIEKKWSK